MKQILIFNLLFLLLCGFNNTHAVNTVNQFVLINHEVPIYSDFVDNKIIDKIDLGISFYKTDQKGNRVQFEYKGQSVWIDQKDVGVITFNAKNFVDESVVFSELPIVSENDLWFAYKNKFYKMDLANKSNPDIQLKAALPNFSAMSATEDRSLLALTGDIKSNNTSILNVALYNTKRRIFSPLTYFYGDSTTMNSLEFSKDNRLLALYYTINDDEILHIYSTATKELLFSTHNILSFSWIDSNLILYTPKKIIMYKTKDGVLGKEIILYDFKKTMDNAPEMAKVGNQYLFQIEDIIYQYTNDGLVKTDFKSIERSPNGDLEHRSTETQKITSYKNKRLRSLSGTRPQWEFMSILDDTDIVYKHQNGAIFSIYIYNIETEKSLPYYWVEEPFYIFQDAVAVEFIIEDDSIFVLLESPGGWVKIIPIHELLK